MEMEPETSIPCSAAALTQSAKPATLSSGVIFRFFRLCSRLAETFSFTFLQPQSAARWTPRRLGNQSAKLHAGEFIDQSLEQVIRICHLGHLFWGA